jgi:hypothetical protein
MVRYGYIFLFRMLVIFVQPTYSFYIEIQYLYRNTSSIQYNAMQTV